jgi:hypothetical protein
MHRIREGCRCRKVTDVNARSGCALTFSCEGEIGNRPLELPQHGREFRRRRGYDGVSISKWKERKLASQDGGSSKAEIEIDWLIDSDAREVV